jgi:hypothetical protein
MNNNGVNGKSSSLKKQRSSPPDEKAVYIKIDTYEMLEKYAHENDTSIRQFINNVLKLYIRKEDFLKHYFPEMSLYSIGKESIFIKDYTWYIEQGFDKKTDNKIHVATAEVSRWIDKNDKNRRTMLLHCSIDDSIECKHIRYALGLPEIALLYDDKEQSKDETEQQQQPPIQKTIVSGSSSKFESETSS